MRSCKTEAFLALQTIVYRGGESVKTGNQLPASLVHTFYKICKRCQTRAWHIKHPKWKTSFFSSNWANFWKYLYPIAATIAIVFWPYLGKIMHYLASGSIHGFFYFIFFEYELLSRKSKNEQFLNKSNSRKR